MCGIAGCVAPPGQRPDREALARMAAALRHRGPDDEGIGIYDNVGLVHTRLAIVDPSPAGHEPMEAGEWVLTYNGEVFNHLDLRAQLNDVPWVGGSDTETLLHALIRWGEDAIPRCNGLYAFAALHRPTGRLLLVRDRWGVKPLYHATRDGTLWFASDPRALIAAGQPRRLDRPVLDHVFARAWSNGPRTLIEGIRRVGAGALVEVRDGRIVEERQWFGPTDLVEARPRTADTRAAAIDALERELRASVQRRLMADVPVGTLCSGGIDSSMVTAFAGPGVVAYNASIADQPDVDEAPYARAVAEHLGVELRTVDITAARFRAALVDCVDHLGWPLSHEGTVPMSEVAKLAHADGVKVLLSGEAADELFFGYGFFHRRDWRDWERRRALHERLPRALLRAIQRRGAPPLDDIAADDPYEHSIATEALAAYAHHRGPRRRIEAGLLTTLQTYLPILLNIEDKATMRASIETRIPFLDPAVVRLALNLPLELRAEPERKGILRDVAARHLPPQISRRTKVGFGFDALRYITESADPRFLADGRLREIWQGDHDEWLQALPTLGGQFAQLLWTAEIWARLYLDGASVASVEQELWR